MAGGERNLERLAADGETAHLRRWGRGRAVRLDESFYRTDLAVHLTVCAQSGVPFSDDALAHEVCASVEFTCDSLGFELYAYCLMPDHLHVLLSPADAGHAVADFLKRMKGFTTARHRELTGEARLWQYSARDRIVRPRESLATLAAYIANNPVRKGLAVTWTEWPYTKVFLET